MLIRSNRGTRLPARLAAEFYIVFASKSNRKKFKFLRKYFLHVEDSNSFLINRFVINNSFFSTIDDTKEVVGFNKICRNFLFGITSFHGKKIHGLEDYGMAYTYIGMAYEYGTFDFIKNDTQAFFHYRKAAGYKNSFGCFKYGQCFEKGLYTKRDPEKMHNFYKLAANLGCVEALHTLGVILMHGLCGVEADIYSGLFYLQLAVKKSDYDYPFTYFDFGECYDSNSNQCIFRDDIYAYDLYQKGAILGCPNSQYKLGNVFYLGQLRIESDLHKAIYWFQSASKSGHVEAQTFLAHFYVSGIPNFLSKDPKQAYLLTLKAAAKGSGLAAYQLGGLIEQGLGTERDPIHALWWYKIAYSLNYKEANAKIEELSKSISTPVAKKSWWFFSILGRGN
ncbi:TPR repeat-containing protein [Tubulinosema ratisbonensis]|uniref:TPR repeat-containing protein n=1 Tax=Tubulinosema ratisbonensis TaxID=291195 RepID=A0A437AIK7_9MICR|nr:TPR repeat-containing protein [Tubulinosema ratisbonensis]